MRCKQCKKKVSAFANVCPYCNAKAENDEKLISKYEEYIRRTTKGMENTQKRKLSNREWITAAVFLFAAVLLFSYGFNKRDNNRQDGMIYYMKGNELIAHSLENNEKKAFTGNVSTYFTGKKCGEIESQAFYRDSQRQLLYYADGIEDTPVTCYNLCVQSTADWEKEPIILENDVWQQVADKNGNLYFVTTKTGCLYQYDGKSIRRIRIPFIKEIHYEKTSNQLLVIAKKVPGVQMKEDGSYTEGFDESWISEDGPSDVFLIDCNSFTEESILEDYEGVYCYTSDYKSLYYVKNNQLFELSLVNKETDKLQDNVNWFAIDKADILYYLSYELKEKSYYDFVIDSCIKEDQQWPETEEAKYHEEQRKRLQQTKVKLFTGTLHSYADGENKALTNNIAGIMENEGRITGEQIRFYANSMKDNFYYEITYGIMDDVYAEIEQDLQGKERWFYSNKLLLYDYSDSSLAIPEQTKAYAFAEDVVGYYRTDISCVLWYSPGEEPEEVIVSEDETFVFADQTYQITGKEQRKLVRKNGNQREEVLSEPIISYRLSGEDLLLVLAGEKDEETHTMYVYGTDGSVELIVEQVDYILG